MTALIQIYNDNKKDSSIKMVPTNSAPSEELISAAESAAAMVQHIIHDINKKVNIVERLKFSLTVASVYQYINCNK